MRTAIFPGTFDPFTIGHESIVRRGLSLMDKVVIAVGKNAIKNPLFPIEQRIRMINDIFSDIDTVEVKSYDGLTVNFAKEVDATFILRGIRNSADLEYENPIAQMNRKLSGIETVFLLTLPEHTPISSSIVRDIYKNNGDVSDFIPKGINLKEYFA
jgi:pantetheine-phosphate adenylyltransferase